MYQNHPSPGSVITQKRPPLRLAGLILLAVMVLLAAWGIFSRHRAAVALQAVTEEQAVPTVVTIKPKASDAPGTLVLPGAVQAYVEAPIYARASGYLKSWSTDIGAVVKKGQLMADIDSPELDDQLRQAQADEALAQANNSLSQSTAKRWQTLLATDSVTRQETDEKVADAAAKAAQVASARANLERLRSLENFKHVVAPFDGVVTARRTDIGALITAGSGVAGQELFRVADRSKLRVYVQVPQSAAAAVKLGEEADLSFADHPGQTFPATVVRTSDAIDPSARTLLVELQVDNARGTLLPGSYAEVRFALPPGEGGLRLPINTLLFRAEGLQAAVLDGSGKVKLVPISIRRDFGTEVEVATGLSANDNVIVNPSDSLATGQVVHAAAGPGK